MAVAAYQAINDSLPKVPISAGDVRRGVLHGRWLGDRPDDVGPIHERRGHVEALLTGSVSPEF
jgi:hypothetical protein